MEHSGGPIPFSLRRTVVERTRPTARPEAPAFNAKAEVFIPPRATRDTARAMSEENVKLALAVADAWNRGDHEAFLPLWDEEAEFYPLRAQLERKSYRGHEGLDRFIAEMAEEWDEVRFEIDEARDAGEQVVGIGRFRARGRASGVDLNVPLGVLTKVRQGKIFYMRLFSEPAEALEAAGLSE
jgi:ketosteroid isomerase-like protein